MEDRTWKNWNVNPGPGTNFKDITTVRKIYNRKPLDPSLLWHPSSKKKKWKKLETFIILSFLQLHQVSVCLGDQTATSHPSTISNLKRLETRDLVSTLIKIDSLSIQQQNLQKGHEKHLERLTKSLLQTHTDQTFWKQWCSKLTKTFTNSDQVRDSKMRRKGLLLRDQECTKPSTFLQARRNQF